MRTNEHILSYRDLMAELRRLCAERRTGTVFITTSENRMVKFGLRDGVITAMEFRVQTGIAALEAIKRITGGRLTFSEEILDQGRGEGLPPTAELLNRLGAPALGADEPSPGDSVAARHGFRWVIESELAEYLGPIAHMVCAEHLARATRGGAPVNVNDVVESLARELGDSRKADRFRERVRARLADTPRSER